METQEILAKAEKLNVFYRDYKKSGPLRRQIIFDVDLDIREGEIVGLVGESGSGKSTLAKALVGINKDITGNIICDRKKTSMIFQDPFGSLNPAFKIGRILEEPLIINGGYSWEERRKKAKEMLLKVELDPDIYDRYPKQLSGGQRQRVCIALSLINSPKLLIADEPVSALDVTIQAQVTGLLKRLKEEMELSILFISHDLRVVYNMCDRVVILKGGKIVEAGNTDEIYFSPKQDYTKQLLDAAGLK